MASMANMARRILRDQQGVAIKQVDAWEHLTNGEIESLIAKYGDEKQARQKFYNAIATLNSTDPHVTLVRIGQNGTSEYRWLREGKTIAPNGVALAVKQADDHTFRYVGQTADGTPLYRDANGVIGMLEWSPL